jgi:hypothetical protein
MNLAQSGTDFEADGVAHVQFFHRLEIGAAEANGLTRAMAGWPPSICARNGDSSGTREYLRGTLKLAPVCGAYSYAARTCAARDGFPLERARLVATVRSPEGLGVGQAVALLAKLDQ